MTFLIRAFLAFTLLFTSQALAFDQKEKEEIQTIIREYLVGNPNVMLEIMQAIQKNEIAKLQEASKQALDENREGLYNDKYSPSIGPKDAKVTIVEFFDYNCGACKMMFTSLNDYLKEDKNVRIIFKEFPIFGPGSEYPARVAQAIYQKEPDKYFDYHSMLMKHQGRVDDAAVRSVLTKMGMEVDEIIALSNTDAIVQSLEANKALATKMRASGTPMVIVGDEVVPHALDLVSLRQKVKEQRAK